MASGARRSISALSLRVLSFSAARLSLPMSESRARPVGLRVQVRPELRQLLHQPDVLLAVELPEFLRHQREQVEVRRDERRLRVRGCFDDGICAARTWPAPADTDSTSRRRGAQKFSGCLAMLGRIHRLDLRQVGGGVPVGVNGAMIITSASSNS